MYQLKVNHANKQKVHWKARSHVMQGHSLTMYIQVHNTHN